jgi:hypothetical protein
MIKWQKTQPVLTLKWKRTIIMIFPIIAGIVQIVRRAEKQWGIAMYGQNLNALVAGRLWMRMTGTMKAKMTTPINRRLGVDHAEVLGLNA